MPRILTSPLVGSRSVASMRSVVVFPAPFGPRTPKISPRSTRRSIPFTATNRSRLSGSRRSRCQMVRRPFSKTLVRPVTSTAGGGPAITLAVERLPGRSLDDDEDPVVTVGDVDDRTGVRDVSEHVVQVDAELRELFANEAARRDLRLAHPRDAERNGDVDLRLAPGRHHEPQGAPPQAGRHRRIRREQRAIGSVWCVDRSGSVAAALLVHITEGPQQPVRLIRVD